MCNLFVCTPYAPIASSVSTLTTSIDDVQSVGYLPSGPVNCILDRKCISPLEAMTIHSMSHAGSTNLMGLGWLCCCDIGVQISKKPRVRSFAPPISKQMRLPNDVVILIRSFVHTSCLAAAAATCSHWASLFVATALVSDDMDEEVVDCVATLMVDARVWCRQRCYGPPPPVILPLFTKVAQHARRVVLNTNYSTPTVVRHAVLVGILRGLPTVTEHLEWQCCDTVIDMPTAKSIAMIINSSTIHVLVLSVNRFTTVRNLLLALSVVLPPSSNDWGSTKTVKVRRLSGGGWTEKNDVTPSLTVYLP
jgi:hypothetical protein